MVSTVGTELLNKVSTEGGVSVVSTGSPGTRTLRPRMVAIELTMTNLTKEDPVIKLGSKSLPRDVIARVPRLNIGQDQARTVTLGVDFKT